jgi:C-terminal processing protease CtpA/Prc
MLSTRPILQKLTEIKKVLKIICRCIPLGILCGACAFLPVKNSAEITSTPTLEPAPPSEKITLKKLDFGVTTLTGDIEYLTDLEYGEYYPTSVIMLQDASHLIANERTSPAPAAAQVLGNITPKGANISEFSLLLPAQPKGTFHDLDNNGRNDKGVQVFYVSLEIERGGSPYFTNYDDWSNYFSSLVFEDKAATRIINGYFLVWAEDDTQSFPSDFGEDGILFTEDDPTKKVKQGFTVIDLDFTPFSFLHYREESITLVQQEMDSTRDLSEMTYSEAFNTVYNEMQTYYAFYGESEKTPNLEEVYAEIFPSIQEAEQNSDANAYYETLESFASVFNDNHISVYQYEHVYNDSGKYYNGHGFMVEEVPDGEFIVSYLDNDCDSLSYGIRLGDKLVSIGGKPVETILAEEAVSFGSYSREAIKREQQITMLTREETGNVQQFEFEISDGSKVNVSSEAYWDNHSYFYGKYFGTYIQWPVQYDVLESGYGYISIVSNNAEEAFIRNILENALDEMQKAGVPGIIIDLRKNSGGQFIKFAEYFLDEPQKIANLVYPGKTDINNEDLQYEVWLHPYDHRYHFNDIAVLIGPECVSACEMEAFAFSKLPDVKMIGSEPTAGAVSLIYGNAYQLPEGIDFNYPIARFVNDEGETILEGQGVAPAIVFPKSMGTISAAYDWLLYYADRYLQYQDEFQQKSEYNPQPVTVDANRYLEMLKNKTQIDLDSSSIESYPQSFVPGQTYTYHTFLDANEDVFVGSTVCTYDFYNYETFFSSIHVRYLVNGEEIEDDYLVKENAPLFNRMCQMNLMVLSDWSEGVNKVVAEVTYDTPLFDGQRWYPAGTYTQQYTVVVKDSEIEE